MRALNLDPNDPMVRSAIFGEQVQDFLRGPIGAYLLAQAEKELARAVDDLKEIDAHEPWPIVRVQERIKLLEGFENWLGAAVQDGLTATAALEGEEHHAD